MVDIFGGGPAMAKTSVNAMLFELVSKTSKSAVFAVLVSAPMLRIKNAESQVIQRVFCLHLPVFDVKIDVAQKFVDVFKLNFGKVFAKFPCLDDSVLFYIHTSGEFLVGILGNCHKEHPPERVEY